MKNVLIKLKNGFSANNTLFASIIIVQLFLTFHGKRLGDYFFGENEFQLNTSFNNTISWISLIFIPAFLTFLKAYRKLSLNTLIIIGVIVGVGIPIFFQIALSANSILIFTLQTYIFGITLITIIIHREFKNDYTIELYELIFEKVLKLIGFILVLFGAGIATLRYVSTIKNEASTGFISSFAYPTIIMIASFLMLGYWIILPCWNQILNSYKSK